jgi:PIN domain
MKINYVLIDYENVKLTTIERLAGEQFRVTVFLGPHDSKLPVDLVVDMQRLGDRGSYVVLDASGHNALDFHIAYYLGALATKDPEGFFHVVSRDTGFDPLIRHLKAHGTLSARSGSIEEMPCFAKPASPPGGGNGQASVGPAPTIEHLVKIAADDLIKRKASRPRKVATLRSTVHAVCGKQLTDPVIDAVVAQLVTRGWVKVSATTVSYELPKPIE